MPYHLELGSEGHNFHGKAIVVNTQTGEHKSLHPIDMERAERQKNVLEKIEGFRENREKTKAEPVPEKEKAHSKFPQTLEQAMKRGLIPPENIQSVIKEGNGGEGLYNWKLEEVKKSSPQGVYIWINKKGSGDITWATPGQASAWKESEAKEEAEYESKK